MGIEGRTWLEILLPWIFYRRKNCESFFGFGNLRNLILI
jgi:hypothetical protein